MSNIDDSIFTGHNINREQKSPIRINTNNETRKSSQKSRKTAMNTMSLDFASTKMSDLVSPEHYQNYMKKVNEAR